jgi:hypothetical protein
MRNKEAEMPTWEVSEEWTSAAAISELGVAMHGQFPSLPCCKIMMILDRYNVKYTTVKGKQAKSEYKKIPVLMIGDKQINDSEIIVKILFKVFDGSDMPQNEIEIEQMTTTGLMIAMEVSVMRNTKDLQRCGCATGGVIGCILWTTSCCIPCCGVDKTLLKKFPDLKSVADDSQEYAKLLGENPFYHGKKAGVIDCSVYGV